MIYYIATDCDCDCDCLTSICKMKNGEEYNICVKCGNTVIFEKKDILRIEQGYGRKIDKLSKKQYDAILYFIQ